MSAAEIHETAEGRRLARAREELAEAEAGALEARQELHAAIAAAVDAGHRPSTVARVAGVTRGRVTQIAGPSKAREPRAQAQKKSAPAARAVELATVAEALPDTLPLLAGVESRRMRTRYGRATGFYDPRTGELILPETGRRVAAVSRLHQFGSVAHVLEQVERASDVKLGRVFLVGPVPRDVEAGATRAEQVRAWALTAPPAGWTAGAHYLEAADLPVLRFTSDAGQAVTILRAAAWWGESDADVSTCASAWVGLGRELDAVRAFAGAGLADTPATTGRALWLRTIPEGKGYPVMSAEVRELIRATSGQGRIELRRPSTARAADFTYLDGRFMYAALTWGMPVGEPRRWTGAEVEGLNELQFGQLMQGRGRWRVTVTVPASWAHVGLLPARLEGAPGWDYPDAPGQRFTTWVDGCELWLAVCNGWPVVVHEGLSWAEGKPLNTWHDGLLAVWERCRTAEAPAAQLAARAVRSILLYAVGAFAATSHPVTRSAGLEDDPDVPAGTEVRRVGERLVWQETAPLSAWSEQTAHPEWAATVWARARVRLLTAPDAGALRLPVERIVGMATDALYIAGGDPGWPDSGAVGRFRVKGVRPGAFTWPTSSAALHQLRDEAEAAGNA